MTEHFERHWLKYAVAIVTTIEIAILLFAYIPHFSHSISGDNADWGNFGSFFWGFGTMCFTFLNVIIFFHIEQRIYRKQMYDTYRVVLEKIIYKLQTKTIDKLDIINMIGVLAGIHYNSAYSSSVQERAGELIIECGDYNKIPSDEKLANLISGLIMFQISLITNTYSKENKVDINNNQQ